MGIKSIVEKNVPEKRMNRHNEFHSEKVELCELVIKLIKFNIR